jgi:hypothetical protein
MNCFSCKNRFNHIKYVKRSLVFSKDHSNQGKTQVKHMQISDINLVQHEVSL